MGDWSIFITYPDAPGRLFRHGRPVWSWRDSAFAPDVYIRSHLPANSFRTGYACNTGKYAQGMLTSIFFRLFSLAPRILSHLLLGFLRFEGISMRLAPLRYWPVMELGLAITSREFPEPLFHRHGHRLRGLCDQIGSQHFLVMFHYDRVLPRSLRFFKALISRLLSRWCRPMLGSSRI